MRIPWALWKPIEVDPGDEKRTAQKALILHTAVYAGDSLHDTWYTGPIESHFFLRKDGTLEQYLDTDHQADAQYDANPWAISMESQDNGDVMVPWTQAQLDSIHRLANDLGVPAKLLKEGPSDGIGYHRQFDSWNQSGHSCPGDPKVAQIDGIIERLKNGGEEDMAEANDAAIAFANGFDHGLDEDGGQSVRPKKSEDKAGWAAFAHGAQVRQGRVAAGVAHLDAVDESEDN